VECNEEYNNLYVQDGTTYFCLNNAVGKHEMGGAPTSADKNRLQLTAVDNDEHDIAFTLSYPNFTGRPLTFSYRLTGGGTDRQSATDKPTVKYSDLGYGSYHFTAQTADVNGEVLDTLSYHFQRPLPFYLSIYAWCAFVALMVGEEFLYGHCKRRRHNRDNHAGEEEELKFFRNLRAKYPNLTPTDLRFCALLRMNLSTKDIAQQTNLTTRGVETARYRIRKKLGIPPGSNLVDFFIDFV
jgi:DNA-binding CsgD family transcriptional regulator